MKNGNLVCSYSKNKCSNIINNKVYNKQLTIFSFEEMLAPSADVIAHLNTNALIMMLFTHGFVYILVVLFTAH